MIHVADLEVKKNGTTICAIAKLDITAHERVLVEGANGSGKSTLLKVLAGLETATSGTVDVGVPTAQRVYVHQSPFLFRGDVRANLDFGLIAHGFKGEERERRRDKWVERLQLGSLVERRVQGLSGGERKRVALVRALVLEPKVLLLDEPLAELDEHHTENLRQALDSLPTTTIVIASPVAMPAAFGLSRVLIAERGRLRKS